MNNHSSVNFSQSNLMDISNYQVHEEKSPIREVSMQTELDHPNTPLKDIGYSGVAGGSSSVLARKEV
jgi:hypothetical protein